MKLIFDTETTGKWEYKKFKFDPAQPRCVQLGAILADDDGVVRGELNLIIKPDGWTVPKEASDIHGITTELAEKHGVPAILAFNLFNRFVQQADTIIAHNFSFDNSIALNEFHILGKPSDFEKKNNFCTMKASTDICKIPGPRGNKWPTLMEAHEFFFKEKFEGAHDAMADVRACKRIAYHLFKTNGQTS